MQVFAHPLSTTQHAFFRPSIRLIRADAQPTPALTVTAPCEQLRWQAPHSIQASRRAISTTLFER